MAVWDSVKTLDGFEEALQDTCSTFTQDLVAKFPTYGQEWLENYRHVHDLGLTGCAEDFGEACVTKFVQNGFHQAVWFVKPLLMLNAASRGYLSKEESISIAALHHCVKDSGGQNRITSDLSAFMGTFPKPTELNSIEFASSKRDFRRSLRLLNTNGLKPVTWTNCNEHITTLCTYNAVHLPAAASSKNPADRLYVDFGRQPPPDLPERLTMPAIHEADASHGTSAAAAIAIELDSEGQGRREFVNNAQKKAIAFCVEVGSYPIS